MLGACVVAASGMASFLVQAPPGQLPEAESSGMADRPLHVAGRELPRAAGGATLRQRQDRRLFVQLGHPTLRLYIRQLCTVGLERRLENVCTDARRSVRTTHRYNR